jgi:hypothetical protein
MARETTLLLSAVANHSVAYIHTYIDIAWWCAGAVDVGMSPIEIPMFF